MTFVIEKLLRKTSPGSNSFTREVYEIKEALIPILCNNFGKHRRNMWHTSYETSKTLIPKPDMGRATTAKKHGPTSLMNLTAKYSTKY